MAITFNLSIPCNTVDFLTNKGKTVSKLKIESKKIAVRYDEEGIIVLRPIIDRLTFGFSPSQAFFNKHGIAESVEEYKESLAKSLYHSAMVDSKASGLSQVTNVPFNKPPWKSYNINLRYKPPSSTEKILIQLKPKSEKSAFMRFDMNPAKLGHKAISEFKAFIEELFVIPGHTLTCDDITAWAAVYRADVAIDILGARPAELEIQTIVGKKPVYYKNHTYNSASGRTETIYPKAKKGKTSPTYIYDKRKELVEANKEPAYGDFLHSRYEFRVQKTSFAKLTKIKNRCGRIGVKALNGKKFHKLHYTQQLFVKYALERQVLEKALTVIPDEFKAKYKAAYDNSMRSIWDAKKIWSFWPDTMKLTGLFSK